MSSDGTISLERGRPLSQAAPLVVGLGYRAFRTVIRITHFPMASSRLTLFIAFPLSLLFGRPYRLPTSIIIGQPLYNAIIWGYHHISFIKGRVLVTCFKELWPLPRSVGCRYRDRRNRPDRLRVRHRCRRHDCVLLHRLRDAACGNRPGEVGCEQLASLFRSIAVRALSTGWAAIHLARAWRVLRTSAGPSHSLRFICAAVNER